MHQHAGAVYCAYILKRCCFKLTIDNSVIFLSLIHFHHQKAKMEFSIHQDMDEEEIILHSGDEGSAALLPQLLSGKGNGKVFLAYKEDNTLLPGDGVSASQSLTALVRIGNR